MITLSKERRRDRLVDERFARSLSEPERAELEAHLASSPTAAERYRRLHLIERVTALGPERALEEPSPMEIDRIAVDLGLVDRPEPPRSWLSWLTTVRMAGFSMAIAATAVLLFVFLPPRETVLTRGAAPVPVTVSTYVVSADGIGVAGTQPLGSGSHLKLRLTRTGELAAVQTVAAVLLDETGHAYVVELGTPKFDAPTVSVPGSFSLTSVTPGRVKMFVVVSSEALVLDAIDGAEITEDALRERLGAAIVDRLELTVLEERPL
jgi:hypothetical protein